MSAISSKYKSPLGNLFPPSDYVANDGVNAGHVAPKISTSSPGKDAKINAVSTSKSDGKSWSQDSFLEQAGKAFGVQGKVRFNMNLGSGHTFQAHLDPNDIVRQKTKRVAQLDVFSGVVVQDFGFKAEILEVKGTTGSAYYAEIEKMNDVFANQNLGNPMPVSVTLDGYYYNAVLVQFNFGRQINQTAGNIVNYQLAFIVLSSNRSGAQTQDTVAAGSSVVKANTAKFSSKFSTGKGNLKKQPWEGSVNDYINSLTGVAKVKPDVVRNFIKDNFNGLVPLPSPDTPLGKDGFFMVPTNLNSILGTF